MNCFPRDTLFLAPMADITHAAFRHLVDSFGGCDYYFTEMVSAGAYVSGSPYEEFYTITEPNSTKTVVQLVGKNQDHLCRAAEGLSRRDIFGIDINMGCSAPEIYRKGWGCALMGNIKTAAGLIRACRSAIDEKKTLSVKLRIGEQDDPEYLVDFCRALQAEGVDFFTLNPRVRKQKLSRPGNWDFVKLLGKRLSVPVIGSGDIRGFSSFARKKENSGAESFMIGRGAARKPWLFTFIKHKLMDPEHTMKIDVKNTAEKFFQFLPGNLHLDFHLSRLKRFFSYYTGNLTFGHRLNNTIQNACSPDEIRNLVEAYFARNPGDTIVVES